MTAMSKYDSLGDHLRKQATDVVPMTFAEIERVTGAKLPQSAFNHRPWWSNNGSNSVITKVWLRAGFRSTRVDMKGRKLVFERARGEHGFAEETRMFASEERPSSQRLGANRGQHPLIGSMKGTFTIEPGWDLTEPAMDTEDLDAMDANLNRTADLIEKGLSKKSR
jgi:hypothetical protein